MLQPQTVQSRIQAAITAAFQAEGLQAADVRVNLGAGYSYSVRLRLESPEVAANHNTMLARSMGLPEDIVGKTLRINGRKMTVVGLNLKAPSKPVDLECQSTGKAYKCNVACALGTLVP